MNCQEFIQEYRGTIDCTCLVRLIRCKERAQSVVPLYFINYLVISPFTLEDSCQFGYATEVV